MNETEWEDYCIRAKIPKARRHLYRHIKLSKLEIIINTVGSIVKLADALGINRGKVQRWSNPNSKEYRKTLPWQHNDALLAWASEHAPHLRDYLSHQIEECCPTCNRAWDK